MYTEGTRVRSKTEPIKFLKSHSDLLQDGRTVTRTENSSINGSGLADKQ